MQAAADLQRSRSPDCAACLMGPCSPGTAWRGASSALALRPAAAGIRRGGQPPLVAPGAHACGMGLRGSGWPAGNGPHSGMPDRDIGDGNGDGDLAESVRRGDTVDAAAWRRGLHAGRRKTLCVARDRRPARAWRKACGRAIGARPDASMRRVWGGGTRAPVRPSTRGRPSGNDAQGECRCTGCRACARCEKAAGAGAAMGGGHSESRPWHCCICSDVGRTLGDFASAVRLCLGGRHAGACGHYPGAGGRKGHLIIGRLAETGARAAPTPRPGCG